MHKFFMMGHYLVHWQHILRLILYDERQESGYAVTYKHAFEVCFRILYLDKKKLSEYGTGSFIYHTIPLSQPPRP